MLRYKGTVFAAFLALLASTAVTLIIPLTVRLVIDEGFSADDAAVVDRYFGALLGVAALMGITTSIRFYLVSWLGERVVTDLRAAVFDHVVGQSPAFFEENHTSEIQSRLTTDTTLIKTVVGSTASFALRNAFLLVGSIVMLVYTSPRLAAVVLVAIPLITGPLWLFGRMVQRLARRSQDTLADTNVFAGEALEFIQTVQAFTHEAADRKRYREVVEVAFETARARMRARSILTALVMFLAFGFVVGLLRGAAHGVFDGAMSGGDLAQFVLYAMFCAMNVAALSEVWGDVLLAAGAAERLFELLSIEPVIPVAKDPVPLPSPPRGEVVFDQVRFAYPTRPGNLALDAFSFEAAPGETIAIVGPSGADSKENASRARFPGRVG